MFNFHEMIDYSSILKYNTNPLDLIQRLNIPQINNDQYSPQILILTRKIDVESDLLGIQFLKHGIDYIKLTEEEIPLQFEADLAIGDENRYVLKIGKNTLDCNNIKIVIFRYFDLKFLKYYSGIYQMYYEQQWYQMFNCLQAVLKCSWINNPKNTFFAENRFNQLVAAKNAGFKIPNTLITNSPSAGTRFTSRYPLHTIVKVLHHHEISLKNISHRFPTTTITPDLLSNFEELKYSPLIFQEKIPNREELRITVVGNKIFPVQITTGKNKDEYSDIHKIPEKDLRFKEIEIDRKLADMCFKLNETLGLVVSSIDLLVDLKGNNYFLEINPVGDWNWLEKHLDLGITDSFLELVKKIIKCEG